MINCSKLLGVLAFDFQVGLLTIVAGQVLCCKILFPVFLPAQVVGNGRILSPQQIQSGWRLQMWLLNKNVLVSNTRHYLFSQLRLGDSPW